MAKYWEITHTRGLETQAVWYMDSAFTLKGTTMAQHLTRINSLTTLDAARSAKEQAYATARTERVDLFDKLHDLNVRATGSIDGDITDDDDLHSILDLIYGVGSAKTHGAILRRARHVAGLWLKFDTALAAETPPRGPLSFKYKPPGSFEDPEVVLQADFATLLTDTEAAQKTEAAKEQELIEGRGDLRSAERRADRDNKRWYEAWTKKYPEGTQEGDAARSQITTEQGTPPPTPLTIASAVPESGSTVVVTYGSGGLHATTKELLYRLNGEADYGHSAPITGPSQIAGPFPAGSTVTFVTRMANSTAGFVLSGPVAVVIP